MGPKCDTENAFKEIRNLVDSIFRQPENGGPATVDLLSGEDSEKARRDLIVSALSKLVPDLGRIKISVKNLAKIVVAQIKDVNNKKIHDVLYDLANEVHMHGTKSYHYLVLATRLWCLANQIELRLHGITTFSSFVKFARNHRKPTNPVDFAQPILNLELTESLDKDPALSAAVDDIILEGRTLRLSYQGLFNFHWTYLLRGFVPRKPSEGAPVSHVIETPNMMFMRVVLQYTQGASWEKLPVIKELYDLTSTGLLSWATPILFNALTVRPFLSSCFMGSSENSIGGIANIYQDMMSNSARCGGWAHDANALQKAGSLITNGGRAGGIVKFSLPFDSLANNCVDQGGKRPASASITVDPSHPDFEAHIQARDASAMGVNKFRNVFPQAMIPDLFFERVLEENGQWSTFCPGDIGFTLGNKALEDYRESYLKLEARGDLASSTKPAKEVYAKIMSMDQITGVPYLCARDNFNRKNMQDNVGDGVIKSSNLCGEMAQVTDPSWTTVCNLGSINLGECVSINPSTGVPFFDYEKLSVAMRWLVRVLDTFIDVQKYTSDKTRKSNIQTRPLGIGIQDLQGVLFDLGIPYDSEEAFKFAASVAECMYYHGIDQSADLAEKLGAYPYYHGSKYEQGILQPDLWGLRKGEAKPIYSGRFDFDALRHKVMTVGVRNSLLVAHMPTASSSVGNWAVPSGESIKYNIFSETGNNGTVLYTNWRLEDRIAEDPRLDLENTLKKIVLSGGSIEEMHEEFDDRTRAVFRIGFDNRPTANTFMAAAMAPFVCMSISLNQFVKCSEEEYGRVIILAWKLGLKTLQYYLRRPKDSKEDKLIAGATSINSSTKDSLRSLSSVSQRTDSGVAMSSRASSPSSDSGSGAISDDRSSTKSADEESSAGADEYGTVDEGPVCMITGRPNAGGECVACSS